MENTGFLLCALVLNVLLYVVSFYLWAILMAGVGISTLVAYTYIDAECKEKSFLFSLFVVIGAGTTFCQRWVMETNK
jgi:drug/metabolite transporter (DMT)-like permease